MGIGKVATDDDASGQGIGSPANAIAIEKHRQWRFFWEVNRQAPHGMAIADFDRRQIDGFSRAQGMEVGRKQFARERSRIS
jgi:hypothetical protein